MFGRKDTEKRSLEDMFTPKDEKESEMNEESESVCSAETENVENSEEKVENFVNEIVKPFDCFGMEEGKTEKWLMKCVKFWYCIMSFIWFLFGATTFAPVIYISNKVNVVFRDKKKAFLFSTILYVLWLMFVVFLITLK